MRIAVHYYLKACLLLACGACTIGLTHALQGRPVPTTTKPPIAAQPSSASSGIPAKVTPPLLEGKGDKAGPSDMQQRAGAVASSFEPEPFDPWISNCHVQTIGGFLLRDTTAAYVPRGNPAEAVSRILQGIASKMQQSPSSSSSSSSSADEEQQKDSSRRLRFWDVRERIETPDGDWFHADTKFATTIKEKPEREVRVLLLHGLESNSDSALSQQMASAYAAQGMTTTCLNFRSCSQNEQGEFIPNDTLGGYHLGFTDDVLHYLERVKDQSPQTEIYLSGFSLGANVALKALGELGHDALERYNIRGAAVACAPLKQEANYLMLHRPGINQVFYRDGLLQKMKQKARNQLAQHCNGDEDTKAFDYRRAVAAETIYDFEDAFLAPIYGFESYMDYYEKTSSIHYLESIAVPTLILNAADDPFFDPAVNPIEKTIEHGGAAPIKLVRTPHGGHLGFCFHCINSEDKRLVALDSQQLQDRQPSSTSSWMPTELARFLQHVQTCSDPTQ